jgi:serine/threonine protein kinase
VYKKCQDSPLVSEIQKKTVNNEVKALYSLRGAPNIVKIYNVLENFERICIILEYCPNGDLFNFVKEKGKQHMKSNDDDDNVVVVVVELFVWCLFFLKIGKLTESEARVLFKQMVEAIKSCHVRGIVHR